jgi:hypothetical protein
MGAVVFTINMGALLVELPVEQIVRPNIVNIQIEREIALLLELPTLGLVEILELNNTAN